MSPSTEQRSSLLSFYDGVASWMTPAVDSLSEESANVVASARSVFEQLIDELPYVDRPQHAMARSMFACASFLAVYQVLRQHSVSAHDWGRALNNLPPVVGEPTDESRARERRDAEASTTDPAPNEFVFEIIDADENGDRGMNIHSCGICHLFGRHDAMDLVPYMCAFDDVMSDHGGQGLRRTGTIALGAKRCDFRFREGDPLRLAEQYPNRIVVDGD